MLRGTMRVLCSLVLVLLAASGLKAQQLGSADLTGKVVDAQGAAVPGAQVKVTAKNAGFQREATTNAEGRFSLTGLNPGEYEVRVGADGFSETVLSKVTLPVGRSVAVAATLKVGAREETVTVEGTQLVNTESSVVDDVITTKTIESLPLNGRNFLELSFLVPGNSPTPNFDPTKTNTVLVSSAGQLGRGSNVTIDGADINDDVVGGSILNVPEDSVQEFQIATNRFSAAIGRSGSSVTNVVTKGGSDVTRGSAAVFLRDHNLQALPATYDRSSGVEPPFKRQQYALTLGGPIVKSKLYWLASVEDRNQDGGILVGTRDLATRTITRSFATAPLDDVLATGRLDWEASNADHVFARYSYGDSKDTSSTAGGRAIGSESQRQTSTNKTHSVVGSWNRVLSSSSSNALRFSWSSYDNSTVPTSSGPQLTFPSILDGTSFRVPQATTQSRFQVADAVSFLRGNHSLTVGGEVQKISADFDLGVFRAGRIEFVQDFPQFDLNGDGVVNDDDLLFAVTLRSGTPDRNLVLNQNDNTHLAFFVQDDWRVRPHLTLNIGVRYELDTNVKNVSGYGDVNPLVHSFYVGDRKKDGNNFGPRVGFNWSTSDGRTSVHGGYGMYFDRVVLEMMSLERGLDGRALPVEVRAGNVFFFDPSQGLPPGAPTLANPFTGFILPGAGAGGINIIDNRLENPTVQEFNLGLQRQFGSSTVVRADVLHNLGTHFLIGRPIGTVFNPVVGGPDVVKNIESSVNTKYDGLLVSIDKRFSGGSQLRASYTFSKAFNYANDDQIPFSYGPVDPNNLQLEYGPTPNDQRHRFVLSGIVQLPMGFSLSPIWTLATAVPMDIMMPDGSRRVPAFQRNAGGRQFKTAAELNAFITGLNATGGVGGEVLLPLVSSDARFDDSFDSLDLRLSKSFQLGGARRLDAIVECFNVLNVTNILGVSTANYSGYSNVLVRDSDNPADPGYLRSSGFGKAVTTAGGVFGSGGPRAFQLGVRLNF